MPLTNAEVDTAVPPTGTPSRSATNAALKALIADIVAAIATARARAGHTGTQTSATISDFDTAADARIAAAVLGALSDVTISAATVGDGLRFDGDDFVNVKGSDLVRTVTGTTDTPTTDDEGKIIRFTNAGAITVLMELPASGTQFTLAWLAGTGTITVDAESDVNLNGLGAGVNLQLSAAAGSATFIPTGSGTWDVIGATGDLVAADITDSSAVGRDVLTAADEDAARAAIDAAGTSQTFGINATFPTGGDDNFVLDQSATFPYTIDSSVTQCDAETATYRLQINGTNVGTTANSVSTSEDTQTHSTANSVAIGDTVRLVRSADAGCVMGRIKANCTRILA
jgi:hypothetical protein